MIFKNETQNRGNLLAHRKPVYTLLWWIPTLCCCNISDITRVSKPNMPCTDIHSNIDLIVYKNVIK